MAELLKNGSIKMRDGRVLWGRDAVQIIDICEIAALLIPAPKVVGGFQGFGGGGGARGQKGDRGPAGPPGSPGAISQIQDEGVDLPVRSILNFLGSSVQATDNPGAGSTDIQINDIFASTRVVSSDPTQGTDLTIQSAMDNVSAGGDIYVKPGIYAMPAFIGSKPFPVTIRGAGMGATILDFGSVAGKFFSIDHDSTINLSDLTIYAGGLPGQYLYDVSTNYLGTYSLLLNNVIVGKFGDPTKSIEGGFLGSALAELRDVVILVQDTAASYFADAGAATPGSNYFVCYDVQCAGIGAFRQRWGGFKNEVGLFTSQSLFGCANFASLGYVFSCDGTSFVGGGGASAITASAFSIFDSSYLNDVAVAPSFDVAITGCLSGIIYTLVDRIIDIADGVDGVSIVGCNLASWAVETIRNAGTNVYVSGCIGFGADILVTETGSADLNQYWGIDVASTIIGTSSRVDGALLSQYSAFTTSAFVSMMKIVNPKGLQGIGTVENKGSNSIDVMQIYTDASGTAGTTTTTVAPSARITLSLTINLAVNCQPPYVSYEVQVKDTVNGAHGLPELFFTSQGAMR